MSEPEFSGSFRQYFKTDLFQDDMRCMLMEGEGSDIIFVLKGQNKAYRAHSEVIAVRCKSLRKKVLDFLFLTVAKKKKQQEAKKAEEQLPEKSLGNSLEELSQEQEVGDTLEIPVRNVNEHAFVEVLLYIYTGEISIVDEALYDTCALATDLGIPSLHNIIFEHFEINLFAVPKVLDCCLKDAEQTSDFTVRVTQYFADNCSAILDKAGLTGISDICMEHILKQENLSASEVELWRAMLEWACGKCDVDLKNGIENINDRERNTLASYIKRFCRPGYLRILNFDPKSFMDEVEPLKVFPVSEMVLKYRFDATAGSVPFEYAFPRDRYSFLTRIRQRTMAFESEAHPHPRGANHLEEVEMPTWVTVLEINFDERTSLSRYSDLEFFRDENKSDRIFSFREAQLESSRRGRPSIFRGSVASSNRIVPGPIRIDANSFWFNFYSPKNVGGMAWGYKFIVSVVQ